MDDLIKERVFIVGAPRSGTTLLQSILASHSTAISFPETHFFIRLFSNREALSLLKIASPKARRYWKTFISLVDADPEKYKLSYLNFSLSQYINSFVKVLDSRTNDMGKSFWIEKTPGHLHYIPYIEKYIDKVKFVHILRDGADVVASLYEIGKVYRDEPWSMELQSLDHCIDVWCEDIQISLQYINKNNHCLLKYEHLTEDTQNEVSRICDFLDIDFEESMITNHSQASKKIVLENEPWKENVSRPINNQQKQKFYKLLSKQEQSYVLEKLANNIDYSKLNL